MDRNTRIAIVGAGAAGLSVAYLLQEAGFGNLTVFEKEERVGGKCKTVWIAGRSYELGAVVHFPRSLAGARILRKFSRRKTVSEPAPVFPKDRPVPYGSSARLLWAGIRYGVLFKAPRVRRQAGHESMPADLTIPFADWLRENRLSVLEPLFASWISGFGYGYAEEIPAAYAIKLCWLQGVWGALFGLLPGGVKHGYQSLWENVARGLDVRLGEPVERLVREEKVTLSARSREYIFDKVILACDLRAIAPALDMDEEEAGLIGRIRSHPYYSILAEAEGMPSRRLAFVSSHTDSRHQGSPVLWYRRWADRNLVNFYAIAREGSSAAEVHQQIRDHVQQMGATMGTIHGSERWDYFPRVSGEDLAAGFYLRLEERQGRCNTYYAGELMSFPTVDHMVGYSSALVRKHFA